MKRQKTYTAVLDNGWIGDDYYIRPGTIVKAWNFTDYLNGKQVSITDARVCEIEGVAERDFSHTKTTVRTCVGIESSGLRIIDK